MFRIITFNANGIRSASRKGFFTWLRTMSPDVLCMQELKAQESDLRDSTAIFIVRRRRGNQAVVFGAA